MVDMDYYLGLKYANQATTANAQANLTNTQAANLVTDQQARARAAQTSADAAMLDARSMQPLRAAQADSTSALIDPTVGHLRAQTGLVGEQTADAAQERGIMGMVAPYALAHGLVSRLLNGYNVVNDRDPNYKDPAAATDTTGAGSNVTLPTPARWNSMSILDDPATLAAAQARRAALLGTPVPGHAKGISKIPGKGSGKVDTVPAMLAPGEAVLNKGAAEHLGRKTVKHLNTIGMAKMGMVGKDGQKRPVGGQGAKSAPTPAKGSKTPAGGANAGGVQHFASGTENVMPVVPSSMQTGQAVGTIPQAPASYPMQRSVLDTDASGRPLYGDPMGGQQPVRYAGGHSQVGKGKKSDTPKPTAANLRTAITALKGIGLAKKPPKGVGNPGMV